MINEDVRLIPGSADFAELVVEFAVWRHWVCDYLHSGRNCVKRGRRFKANEWEDAVESHRRCTRALIPKITSWDKKERLWGIFAAKAYTNLEQFQRKSAFLRFNRILGFWGTKWSSCRMQGIAPEVHNVRVVLRAFECAGKNNRMRPTPAQKWRSLRKLVRRPPKRSCEWSASEAFAALSSQVYVWLYSLLWLIGNEPQGTWLISCQKRKFPLLLQPLN